MDDFNKPKIVWARLMRISKSEIDAFPRFCYVQDDFFVVDSLCFFVGKNLDKLKVVLNSMYAAYYFLMNVAILDNGGCQMRQQYIEDILIPNDIDSITTEEDLYHAFGFSNEEVQALYDTVRRIKDEILDI